MTKKKAEPDNILTPKIEERAITDELQESYLDYAMSVIVSRALPDVRDGLKPVQRRILWAMWDMGLGSGAKFIKSARVVGETMGKFHPHGDAAVYDALVRMTQDFSLRYPLIWGQGNFGNIDGDSAAAQRYTEAKLSKIAEELLKDIEKETVDWRPNYDNTRKEPEYLPAKLPNLILNGTMGIAVGMATNIPPHNLREVVNGLVYLAEHPDATVKDLMKFIPGPDFPTGGIIYGKRSLEEAYATGRGSITIRATTDIEEFKGGYRIVVSEIPYQVVKSTLIEKIAFLVQNKKIDGIKDVRDESDREGLRIVIDLKQGTNPHRVLNQLFKHTDLQKNYYFNMVALMNGIQPQVFSLKGLLTAYIEHRQNVVVRRTKFELVKAEERAHILEGLVKALGVIDKVISTIKKSKDRSDAHKNLVKKFKLTSLQADAILDMKLQTLASLETKKIKDELKEKRRLIIELKAILKSKKKITEIIIKELKELEENYADGRRTKLSQETLKEFKQEDFVPKEEAVVFLTTDGYIKRVLPSAFRAQRRGGQGLIGFDLREEDKVDKLLLTSTHDNILFFTDRGKVYQTKVYEIPASKRVGGGKLVHTFLGLKDDERITAMISYSNESPPEYLIMATEEGIIKRIPLEDFRNIRRSGIIAIILKKGDVLRWVGASGGQDDVVVVTKGGQSIRFREKEIRPMGRNASGVKSIKLRKGDLLTGLVIIKKGEDSRKTRLLVVTENGFGKQTPLKEYKVQKRGGGGIKTARITDKTGYIAASQLVNEETTEILAFSAKGQVIRTKLKDIRISGRSTQGVRIMKLNKGDSVAGIILL